MKHQIFISYRRNGGEAMAQLLHDNLVKRGFVVFYDIETLKSGPFDEKLYEKIEECDDFLLVLPPQALDRCIYEEDWVRKEIAHALAHGKNIIPVMMRGFVFPKDLPEDIARVSAMNGVEFENMKYLDARIDEIVSMLRTKKPAKDVPVKDDAPSLIYNVCSLGSCDFNNPYPSDAYYSEIIDRDRYNIVYFHLTTALMPEKESIDVTMEIYDEHNACVAKNTFPFEWSPEYCRLSLRFVIRGQENSFVKHGLYRAEFRIDDSRVYEYYFRVVSAAAGALGTGERTDFTKDGKLNKKVRIPPSDLDKKLSRPKGFGLHFLTSFFLILLYAAVSAEYTFLAFVSLVGWITFSVLLLRYTQKYVNRNWLFALLIAWVCFWYYGFYLFFTMIRAWVNRAKWRSQ